MAEDLLENWRPLVAITGFVLFWTWESFVPLFRFERRGRHAARNLGVAGLNALMAALLFAGATVAAATFVERAEVGLSHRLPLGEAGRYVLGFVALDLWAYWWHRFNHAIPLLWRFHRVHHSDPAMDVSTATRFHAGEIAISFGLRLGVVVFVGVPLAAIVVYDAVQLVSTQFHHSNVALPARLDRWLRLWVVSPNMHKVHHSVERVEMDSNYSTVLSVWDRLFGSFRGRDDFTDMVFGVPGLRGEERQSIAGMLRTPFDSLRREVRP